MRNVCVAQKMSQMEETVSCCGRLVLGKATIYHGTNKDTAGAARLIASLASTTKQFPPQTACTCVYPFQDKTKFPYCLKWWRMMYGIDFLSSNGGDEKMRAQSASTKSKDVAPNCSEVNFDYILQLSNIV